MEDLMLRKGYSLRPYNAILADEVPGNHQEKQGTTLTP